ncbi:uncharacterized protein LOC123534440 [Mercenaria mercenaria]|uniref:uncharacterized protein LOC123534440 n=1 Tax=Mercenaria mercenaria TaxID=6596 RepID=UPI00234F4D0F|nr:uncharacterized protein LOC123534440 [Mercenaria mercenaria]
MTSYKNGKRVPVYRQTQAELRIRMLWATLKAMFECLCQYARYIWDHNPLKVLSRRHRRLYFVENYGEIMIKPKFGERVLDLLLSDYRRRQRLLNWVHSRLGSHINVHDFSTCWQDGTALCALLESICPGVCPSYHLLSGHNRVKNCRLGLKLANKYLYVPMDLISAEEFAIANKTTENKIIQYISMVKWASQNIKEKWSSLHESLIAAKTGRCFAKGSGLKSGIVEKRSKFTVLVSDTIGVFNLLIEVRGPNHEYCGERIVSLHQAKALLDKSFDYDVPQSDNIKYLEDCAGNTFVRKRIPARYETEATEPIYFDIQCGEEGTFYVTFVPRMAGMHAVAVKWQNHHVENSPFRIKVYKASNVSTKNLKGAQEKRVIYDSLSFSSHSADTLDHPDVPEEFVSHSGHESHRSISAMAKAKAYSKGRQLTVTRRRVLRRIITRNGEDIVIEEAISPSLSRQSSITDNSDEDTRHHRTEKDEATTASQGSSVVKSHSAVLNTVPEERQGSKDSDHSNSMDQTSVPTPQILKYKCTELDEHNRLDDHDDHYANSEHKRLDESQNVAEHEQNEKITLYEQYAHNTERAAKRSALKRSSSKNHPYKAPAKRTTSDGPVYKLRRGLVSVATCDLSDSGSELSSGDKHNTDGNDSTSPTLKLLHSSSLKKSCMYISEKAVNQTSSSFDSEDMTYPSIPVKTKLRATQSLPIMRKYWKRDLTSEDSIKGLINSLQKINSIKSLPSLDSFHVDIDETRSVNDLQNSQTLAPENDSKVKTPTSPKNRSKLHDSPIETVIELPDQEQQGDTLFSFEMSDLNAYKKDRNSPALLAESNAEKTDDNVHENQVPDTPSGFSVRGNLTRQTTIFCQKSSVDSSSGKTDHSSDEKKSSVQSSSSKSSHFRAFRSIYIHSDRENNADGKNEVTIIIPKAKIDKCTQVSHVEITKETGWDLLEGVYLLLRKISIKIPSETDVARPAVSAVANPVEIMQRLPSQEDIPTENISPYRNLLQVPLSPRDDRDYPRRPSSTGNNRRIPNIIELEGQFEQFNNESHRNVNAWFERNSLLNGPNRLAPVRQYTMETVDSGFDDSQSPASYNRQGRHSLPNVLSGNGHVRLYRRPYRGPQIPLEPSLVNSNSSQSVSLEHREAGNDADDELPPQSIPCDTNKQQTRKRHKRINREDSFSLSDSELNERRKRLRRRNFTFDHTVSRNDDNSIFGINGEQRDIKEVIKEILARNRKASTDQLLTDKSTNQSLNSGEEGCSHTDVVAEDFKVEKSDEKSKRYPTAAWKQRLGTLTSVDSNYCGFGVSKSTRSDFLSQINSFQNLCPTDETSDEISEVVPTTKITHWQDENVIIPYSDENIESHDENELPVDSELSEHSCDEPEVQKSHAPYHTAACLPDVENDKIENSSNESFDGNQVAVHSTQDGTIRSSTYFDIFSSFDHSHLHDDVEPSNVAMLGDVISLATNTGEQTIFRMAGAGLRYGTVGGNNSFQVWVENPTPGSLTVTITGPQSHSVTETSVIYTGDNLYEISYGVAHPGKYKIYVRWGDRSLSKHPYICEATL